MKLLKNPEIKKELIIYLAIAAFLAAAGFFVNIYCGAGILISAAAFSALWLVFSYKRYRKIEKLSEDIDRILHGYEEIYINDSDEGELAVLKSEIGKMTLTLREQSKQLLADKKNLSDSIEDIFHQIRTPLTAMNINVEMLKEKELPYERRLVLARALSRDLERVRWLVESLLKMAQIDASVIHLDNRKVSLDELISKAAGPLLIPAEVKGVKLEVNCDGGSFYGDLKWSAEALSNLIKNAVEHTPEGGKVTVNACENVLFSRITVRDTGEGFGPEDTAHIFERFYRGKNASPESIGIGLALSRMIITAQNGTVTADNCDDGGAVFDIKFYKKVI